MMTSCQVHVLFLVFFCNFQSKGHLQYSWPKYACPCRVMETTESDGIHLGWTIFQNLENSRQPFCLHPIEFLGIYGQIGSSPTKEH